MSSSKHGFSHQKILQPFNLLVVLLVLAAMVILFWPKAAVSQSSLGQCLTSKGVTMYGSDLCPNCQNQKKILGGDFKNVTYINCDFEKDLCEKRGITVYPVWSMDNAIMLGTQSKEDLATFAGCEIFD
jgi:hypothetical protein